MTPPEAKLPVKIVPNNSLYPEISNTLFQCKPFDGMSSNRCFIMPSTYVQKEVRDRMCNTNPQPMDLMMREIVLRYGARWITLEQIYCVAAKHRIAMSPFRPWVLYTCVLTFPRAEELGDTPWGFYLPYFIMSSHSAMHEAKFRVADEFAKFAPKKK